MDRDRLRVLTDDARGHGETCHRCIRLHPAFWVEAAGVEHLVNPAWTSGWFMPQVIHGRQQDLQLIIRQKLQNGTLPYNSIPQGVGRTWQRGGVRRLRRGSFTKDEWVIEGIALAGGRKPLQLHVECFHLWQQERRVAHLTPTAPAIDAGGASSSDPPTWLDTPAGGPGCLSAGEASQGAAHRVILPTMADPARTPDTPTRSLGRHHGRGRVFENAIASPAPGVGPSR